MCTILHYNVYLYTNTITALLHCIPIYQYYNCATTLNILEYLRGDALMVHILLYYLILVLCTTLVLFSSTYTGKELSPFYSVGTLYMYLVRSLFFNCNPLKTLLFFWLTISLLSQISTNYVRGSTLCTAIVFMLRVPPKPGTSNSYSLQWC